MASANSASNRDWGKVCLNEQLLSRRRIVYCFYFYTFTSKRAKNLPTKEKRNFQANVLQKNGSTSLKVQGKKFHENCLMLHFRQGKH